MGIGLSVHNKEVVNSLRIQQAVDIQTLLAETIIVQNQTDQVSGFHSDLSLPYVKKDLGKKWLQIPMDSIAEYMAKKIQENSSIVWAQHLAPELLAKDKYST